MEFDKRRETSVEPEFSVFDKVYKCQSILVFVEKASTHQSMSRILYCDKLLLEILNYTQLQSCFYYETSTTLNLHFYYYYPSINSYFQVFPGNYVSYFN